MVNEKGCKIEPGPNGLFSVTVTEQGKPVRIERDVGLLRAAAIFEEEAKKDIPE